MNKGELEFDGKEVILVNKKTGEEIMGYESLKENINSLESKEEVKYVDESFEDEFDAEAIEELQQIAKEHLSETTPKEIDEVIGKKLKEVVNLAEAYEELKKHYIGMQREADLKAAGDGGEDKTNPDYYRLREMESIEIMELKHGTRAVMAFCVLTSERYEYRVGNKLIQEGNPQLDMEKADWYLNKYLELRDKLDSGEEVEGMSSLLM